MVAWLPGVIAHAPLVVPSSPKTFRASTPAWNPQVLIRPGHPTPPPPGGHSTTITVGNGSNSFSPTPDTIPAGTITFHWATNAVTHNVTWQTGPSSPAGSGNKAGGDPDYATPVVVGTYTYHCTLHTGMNGTLVVQ